MPQFKLLTDGTLEIAARGTWRLIPGCSCAGIYEYSDRMVELAELVEGSDAGDTLESLYINDRRFRWLCDRVLTLNGCDLDWVRPADLGWLVFGWLDEDGAPQRSPLALLNEPPQPRHPRKPSPADGPSDLISLIAAIASQPGVGMEEAVRVANSAPFRQVVGVLEDRAWGAMDDKEKEEVMRKEVSADAMERIRRGAGVAG